LKNSQRNNVGWKEFYPEAVPNKRAQLIILVDADHAPCKTQEDWLQACLSKMVETSTYGSGIVAARIAPNTAMDSIG
jgi:hypothetical protein